jgi:hypothetical protein
MKNSQATQRIPRRMRDYLRQFDQLMVLMRNHRMEGTRVASLNLFSKIEGASGTHFLNEIHRCQAEQNRHEKDNSTKNYASWHKRSCQKTRIVTF